MQCRGRLHGCDASAKKNTYGTELWWRVWNPLIGQKTVLLPDAWKTHLGACSIEACCCCFVAVCGCSACIGALLAAECFLLDATWARWCQDEACWLISTDLVSGAQRQGRAAWCGNAPASSFMVVLQCTSGLSMVRTMSHASTQAGHSRLRAAASR